MVELQEAQRTERLRCVNIVWWHSELAAIRGHHDLADYLEALAAELEHGLFGGADLTHALDPERW